MATLDPKVSVADIYQSIVQSKVRVERAQAVEKDEENRAYLSGKLDALTELEGLLLA